MGSVGKVAGGKKGFKLSMKRPFTCLDCEEESKRKAPSQKRCPSCAKISSSKQSRASEYRTHPTRGNGRGGTHNGAWVGGSASWQIREFRGTECERCRSDGPMHLHHRDRDRANWEEGNLETLCVPCHQEEHRNDKGEEHAVA